MKLRYRILSSALGGAFCCLAPVAAQEEAKPAEAAKSEAKDFGDKGWPQIFETSTGYEVAIPQPQIHEWTDYRRMVMRAALVLKPKGGDESSTQYGAITVETDTTVDKEERVVFLGDREITELSFPNVSEEKA